MGVVTCSFSHSTITHRTCVRISNYCFDFTSATLLPFLAQLEVMDLSWNDLVGGSLKALAAHLHHVGKLRVLKLCSCRLTDQDLTTLGTGSINLLLRHKRTVHPKMNILSSFIDVITNMLLWHSFFCGIHFEECWQPIDFFHHTMEVDVNWNSLELIHMKVNGNVTNILHKKHKRRYFDECHWANNFRSYWFLL